MLYAIVYIICLSFLYGFSINYLLFFNSYSRSKLPQGLIGFTDRLYRPTLRLIPVIGLLTFVLWIFVEYNNIARVLMYGSMTSEDEGSFMVSYYLQVFFPVIVYFIPSQLLWIGRLKRLAIFITLFSFCLLLPFEYLVSSIILKYRYSYLSGNNIERNPFDWFQYFWSHGVCCIYYLIIIGLIVYGKNIFRYLNGKLIDKKPSA